MCQFSPMLNLALTQASAVRQVDMATTTADRPKARNFLIGCLTLVAFRGSTHLESILRGQSNHSPCRGREPAVRLQLEGKNGVWQRSDRRRSLRRASRRGLTLWIESLSLPKYAEKGIT